MELLEDLETLRFEDGIPEEDRFWLYLRGRTRGLRIEACAHAVFFCKLLLRLRKLLYKDKSSSFRPLAAGSLDLDPESDEILKLGIIGSGQLGKQLAFALLKLVPLPPESLRISTRRPESLVELRKQGVQCFYQNSSLVSWANVLFLCCLPAQLPNICLDIQSSLEKTCTVYSFVSAIPLPRLKLLLNHTNILKAQYHFGEDLDNIWGVDKDITAALQDPVIVQATCPYSSAGGIVLNIKWLEGVFYALINICTARNMFHSEVLQLFNKLFLSAHLESCEKDKASCPKFQLSDFLNKTYVMNMFRRRPFPWFDLITVQLKETPFSQRLSASIVLQDHLTRLYYDSFGLTLAQA
uniref:NADP-dependent oxidoreductase domain-containing protein 1 n=1 Tax=Jaculus jaculus TaxID=51337 RepID=UPI001E1B2C23